jgi:hypothetical protein
MGERQPWGLRRAWCEIRGGHRSLLLWAKNGEPRVSHLKLHCVRCGRETGWLPTAIGEVNAINKAVAKFYGFDFPAAALSPAGAEGERNG